MTDTRTVEQIAFQRASYRQIKGIGLVPRMTQEQRRQFVIDYIGGRIFTSADLQPHELPSFSSVFMLFALGALDGWEEADTKKIGCVWEYLDRAGPRGFSRGAGRSLPMFLSMRFMHIEDWERCAIAIDCELTRMKDIEV